MTDLQAEAYNRGVGRVIEAYERLGYVRVPGLDIETDPVVWKWKRDRLREGIQEVYQVLWFALEQLVEIDPARISPAHLTRVHRRQ